jgi:cellulose synthase/poly-beta-1,6-N-acetylglucosamine synthase-like glycosyltransferase
MSKPAPKNNIAPNNHIMVSVIIPTYRDWERLQLCLNALSSQTYPQENFETIVVNNDPKDKVPGSLIIPKNCKLLEEKKTGSYAARNKALSIAQGDIYAFTDSDCQPQNDWLATAVAFFDNNPGYQRIGGAIELLFETEKLTWAEIYEKAFAFSQKQFVATQGMAATANMIAKRQVFDKTGKFNEALMSGGDVEWGKRAHLNGFKKMYVPECIVWHPTRSTISELIQKNKRVAGGHFALRKEGNKINKLFFILLGILPPFFSLMILKKNNTLTWSERIIAFIIRYFLRLVAMKEKLLLFFGKKAERV